MPGARSTSRASGEIDERLTQDRDDRRSPNPDALGACHLVLFAVGPGMTASMALSVPGWFVAVFACVLVHEPAHSLLARHRSFKVRDVSFMPLGGFSEIIANSPTDETVIPWSARSRTGSSPHCSRSLL